MVIKLNVIRVNFTRGVVVFDSIMGTLTSPLYSAFDAIGHKSSGVGDFRLSFGRKVLCLDSGLHFCALGCSISVPFSVLLGCSCNADVSPAPPSPCLYNTRRMSTILNYYRQFRDGV